MAQEHDTLAHSLSLTPAEILNIERVIVAAAIKVKPSLRDHPFTLATNFAALGLDSLQRLTLVYEVEEHFNIDIISRPDGAEGLDGIEAAIRTVAGLLAKRP